MPPLKSSEPTRPPVCVLLPARLENLSRFISPVLIAARTLSLGEDRLNDLELALEEVLVNIFTHAYPEEEGMVQVTCQKAEKDLVVSIEDDGVAFNVTETPPPDLDSDVLDRPLGGLGVHLVKNLMDAVFYRRKGGRNILELRLSLSPGKGSVA